ncbi:hypothetical protein C7D71_31165, partial [Klebsiella pneumoniae]
HLPASRPLPARRALICLTTSPPACLLPARTQTAAANSTSSSSQQTASGEKSINLSDDQSASMPAAGQDPDC